MAFMRILLPLVFLLSFSGFVAAQDAADEAVAQGNGNQTLEDILARQRGEDVPHGAQISLPEASEGAPANDQLGTRGGASDSMLWREMRANEADITASNSGPAAKVLMQDRGMWWLNFREGPLITYGGWLLIGTIILLALFYLIRGRIRIEHGRSEQKIERFKAIERFGHWLLAISFVLLGITGIITLMGRKFIIPAFGHESFATIAVGSKWIHNNVSWAFMIALVLIFVMWVVHNLPDRTDINWMLKGGGIFGKQHPPAKKFNAGQKIIFWSVILLGGSIAASGLSLLFPFEFAMFGPTFAKLNSFGISELLGLGTLETALSPQEEMQYAQLWHAIVSFVLMAIVLAHIYIGSVGMEGAYDAMGSGEVDLNWAREHHSLWVEEVEAKEGKPPSTAHPAE